MYSVPWILEKWRSHRNTTLQNGSLDVDFEGEDMGILIGKRGQTLDSLQYLTSLVVNKGESTYIRVKLDTEDYRRRRKETLENLARGIAFKVKKTKKTGSSGTDESIREKNHPCVSAGQPLCRDSQ